MNSGDVPTNAAVLPLQRAMPVTGPSGRVSPTDGRRWKPRLLNGRGERSPSPDDILNCRRPAISTDATRGFFARAKSTICGDHEKGRRKGVVFRPDKSFLHTHPPCHACYQGAKTGRVLLFLGFFPVHIVNAPSSGYPRHDRRSSSHLWHVFELC